MDIEKVLTLLRQAEMSVIIPKYNFYKKVEYLTHVLIPGWVSTASKNVTAINTIFFSTDNTQLKSFWVHVMCIEDLS